MNTLDWILVVLMGAYALSGYWQGFITGAAATIGLLFGGFVGIAITPMVLGNAPSSTWVSVAALFLVIVCASIGQAVFQYAGAKLRSRIRWQPARALDAMGGAVLGSMAVLVVAWSLGVAISGTSIGPLTSQVRNSTVLAHVDAALPDDASRALNSFNDVVGTSFFPRYLEPFAPERIVDVPAGPARLLKDPDIMRAQHSVLKVRSNNRCGQGIEGTGFIYAPGRLLTNAHVVAGVTDPQIITPDGTITSHVVVFDPNLDIAVLAFADQGYDPLILNPDATAGEGVAILGYPNDGPFTVGAARIRAEQKLQSPNIYGHGKVLRTVFSLRGKVRPGNSGGPILSSNGDVVGVIFAASVTDSDTGYALTAEQVAQRAREGLTATETVSTQGCAT